MTIGRTLKMPMTTFCRTCDKRLSWAFYATLEETSGCFRNNYFGSSTLGLNDLRCVTDGPRPERLDIRQCDRRFEMIPVRQSVGIPLRGQFFPRNNWA